MGPRRPARRAARRALLGRALEAAGLIVGRITIEILRPVPLAPLTVATRVVRPGRNVELVEAVARRGGRRAARARPRDRVAAAAAGRRPARRPTSRRPPGPRPRRSSRSSRPARRSATTRRWTARSSRARSSSPGRRVVWLRMRQPLVDGEPPSPLVRVLVAADSGNGVSADARLPPLPVHQHGADRPPRARARGRVGLPRRGHAHRAARASAWPRASSPTRAGASAAPPRRCSCASDETVRDVLHAAADRPSPGGGAAGAPVATPRHEHPALRAFCDGRPPPSMTASGG